MPAQIPVRIGGNLQQKPPRGTEVIEYGWPPADRTLIASGDTFVAFEEGEFGDKTVQVSGTFGAGTITIIGTNQVDESQTPINFVTLHDYLGTALSITSAGVYLIAENPRFISVGLAGAGFSGGRVTFYGRHDKSLKQTG